MIPQAAVDLVKKWEGFRANPYICPAGVWTIGYGTTRYPDGRAVAPGDSPVTEQQAEEYLIYEMEQASFWALFYSPVLGQFPDRLAAIISFIYNLGPGRYKASTLRRRVNQQDWPEAVYEIQRWVWGGGRKLPGLIARRREEASLLQLRM